MMLRSLARLQDVNVQLVDCMNQIKSLAEEKALRDKELEELRGAARAIVDMLDPPEEGVVDNRSLLDRLHEAP